MKTCMSCLGMGSECMLCLGMEPKYVFDPCRSVLEEREQEKWQWLLRGDWEGKALSIFGGWVAIGYAAFEFQDSCN